MIWLEKKWGSMSSNIYITKKTRRLCLYAGNFTKEFMQMKILRYFNIW